MNNTSIHYMCMDVKNLRKKLLAYIRKGKGRQMASQTGENKLASV